MAFNPLTEAECGQKNPLVRLTSHLTHDHTFGDLHGHQAFPSTSDQLVEQFLHETKTAPQSYRMDDLMREMHEIESQRSALPPVPASAVKTHLYDNSWAEQYISDERNFNENVNNEAVWAEISSQEQNLVPTDWAENYLQNQAPGPSNASQESARQLLANVDDSKFVYSKFMRFMNQVGEGNIDLEQGRLTEQEADMWSQEFMQTKEDNVGNLDAIGAERTDALNKKFLSSLQEELQSSADAFENNPWFIDGTTDYIPKREYVFTQDNPMFDLPNPLERGKILLQEGDLPSAVLCFEAAVKQEPENAEAWFLLGKTQAENEQDSNAIPALQKCLDIQQDNLDALMALAVSYTNESYYSQAGKMLLKWLEHNPKYRDLVPDNFKIQGDDHKSLQELYIKAALRNPENIDYEVQCGLGVLFNLSGEYDKAADCFRSALSVKPDDAKLWNRLGATLANGTKSEEAVDAYHHALQLEPGFIRARYNVGIICINLGAHKEAAEHFLTALNQQARGKDMSNSTRTSQMSDTIWSTLRMCIALGNRPDLRTAVDNRDLETLNKAYGIMDN